MSFLPSNYEAPAGNSSANYFKFTKGENRFRILGSAIVGELYFNNSKKPVRKRVGERIDINDVGVNGIKHFWAFPVLNVSTGTIQIMEITQKTIMSAIKNLEDNPDWGDLTTYDIIVTRTGDDKETTRYTVMPTPKKALDPGVAQYFKDMNINLKALYDGGDPFAATTVNEDVNPNDLPF